MSAKPATFDHPSRAVNPAAPPVWNEYADPENAFRFVADSASSLLGLIAFGAAFPARAELSLPMLSIPIEPLAAEQRVELWHSGLPATRGACNGVSFAHNGAVLFGTLSLSESPAQRLETTTVQAYTRILDVIRAQQYPHLVRMWHYFPSINLDTHGMERYRQFCMGRHQAFAERGLAPGPDLPAASAIGSRAPGLYVYFLAARTPGIAVENPRQVSAYCYPPRYSPRQPAFSRAVIQDWGHERQIYISGTASIVGHESRHRDDLAAQIEETLGNIRALLRHAAGHSEKALLDLHALSSVKVYLRRPDDLQPARNILGTVFAPDTQVLYLAGDICRSELLIEIEGVMRLPCSGTGHASTA